MIDNNVHSTLFFKYLRVARNVYLFFVIVIIIHFLLLVFFPQNRMPVTYVIWIFSEILTIAAGVFALRRNSDLIKRAWLFLIIYGFLNFSGFLIRIISEYVLSADTMLSLPACLFASGNVMLIVSFILFSQSREAEFKTRRQLNLLGLILVTILIISYLINYKAISTTNSAESIAAATIIGVINLSAFIFGTGIYWMGIWKKDINRKTVFIIILVSTFLTFILNNFYHRAMQVAGGFPASVIYDLAGTAAILLIGIAAWHEAVIKKQPGSDSGHSLFYVSRIERIIPVISLIAMLAVLYFNLYKLDNLLIKSMLILMIPYNIFLLFFELYSYRSEDAILSVLSVSPIGIHITDRCFKKTYFINKSLNDIFKSQEIPPDIITGNSISEDLRKNIFGAVALRNTLNNIEMVLTRSDGTKFNAQCKIIPAKYYSYEIVISWIWDITDRKKYEGAILQQKYSAEITTLYKSEILNNLTNRIQSGYVTMKPDPGGWPDFILTGMNRRVLELFRFRDDLSGKKLREVFPAPDPGLISRFFEVLTTGVSVKRELYFEDIDRIFLFLIFRASEDEVACLIDDITENKRKERELVERERELSALLGNLPGMAFRCMNNREWTMTFVSQGSFELSGYKPEELAGERDVSWNDLIYPDDRERVWLEVQEAYRSKGSFHLEYRIITRDLSVKYVWEQCLGVFDEDDKLLFLEGFIFDITKQKEAEAVLRENEMKQKEMDKARALGQMAGGIAHDLNNRLMGIGSYASLIDMKVKDINLKKYIDGIHESILKSTELIDNLLIFARQSDINSDTFSVHSLLRELALNVKAEFPLNITIISLYTADDDSVKGDYKQIYKAVLDIVSNARDAMPDGGKITISTENKTVDNTLLSDLNEGNNRKPFIVITVSDSGHGIEKENLSRIFDPFYTTKPVGKGKGLGLSAVYGTIQAHKGAITVDSTPGQGTAFSIYLPVA